ncbi:MAG: hypothetical protein AAB557_02980 [Patescibacteria group bacterium]
MKRVFVWRKYGKIVFLSLAGILMSGLFAWAVNAIFTIRNVEVSGEGIQIEVDATKFPNSLLFFPVVGVREQILKEYPLVGSVILTKKYPSTLVIKAVPRKPFAIVGIERETYLLDEDGVVLEQYSTHRGLPVIRIAISGAVLGTKISDPTVSAAVGFLSETAIFVRVLDIVQYDNSSLKAQSESMSIVFPQHADIPALARTLQTVTAGFRIKGKLPTIIDLRFDKPVVTF